MSSRPLFLLTNDDGVHAPGLRAMAEAVASLADVVIVAPHVERSGAGQSLSLHYPLRAERIGNDIHAVEGTPTDCVLFALNKVLRRKPDLVLSGINRGLNIGQDTLYSGTVAGAMEAAVHGIPAVAFSLRGGKHFTIDAYRDAAEVVKLVVAQGESLGMAKGRVLNVNVPDVPLAAMKGVRVARLGRRVYDSSIVEAVDPRGRPYFWIGGGGESFVDDGGDTDCQHIFNDYVTVTAIQPDHTDLALNALLESKLGASLERAMRTN